MTTATSPALEQLKAELAQAREVHERMTRFESPGHTMVQPWVIAMAKQRVVELELRVEHARDPQAHQAPAPVKREPAEFPAARAARIRASRERRLRDARDRVDAYERRHPINEHGVRTGPSTASNNWRHRNAAVDRDVAQWRQYEQDIKTIRHLTGLLEEAP